MILKNGTIRQSLYLFTSVRLLLGAGRFDILSIIASAKEQGIQLRTVIKKNSTQISQIFADFFTYLSA